MQGGGDACDDHPYYAALHHGLPNHGRLQTMQAYPFFAAILQVKLNEASG